jgi:hypothetical protein
VIVMTTVRNALLTSAVVLACATPTLAQEGMNPLAELQMMYLDQQGQMSRWRAGRGSHERMMRVGKPVPAGTIFYRSGGKLYMAQNRRAPNGKWLIDEFRADPPQ